MAQPPPYGAPSYPVPSYPPPAGHPNTYASAPPPPTYVGGAPAPPQQQGYGAGSASGNVVYVVHNTPPQPERRGFLSGIISDVSRGIGTAARDVTGVASKFVHGDIMKEFATGAVIQLYVKKTGKTLQIVQSPNGNLVVDFMGYLSPQASNAHWIVYQELSNIVKLYNQDNFLGVMNGQVVLYKATNPAIAPPQTRWKVVQTSSSTEISLLSMNDCGSYLSTTADFNNATLDKESTLSSHTYFSIHSLYQYKK